MYRRLPAVSNPFHCQGNVTTFLCHSNVAKPAYRACIFCNEFIKTYKIISTEFSHNKFTSDRKQFNNSLSSKTWTLADSLEFATKIDIQIIGTNTCDLSDNQLARTIAHCYHFRFTEHLREFWRRRSCKNIFMIQNNEFQIAKQSNQSQNEVPSTDFFGAVFLSASTVFFVMSTFAVAVDDDAYIHCLVNCTTTRDRLNTRRANIALSFANKNQQGYWLYEKWMFASEIFYWLHNQLSQKQRQESELRQSIYSLLSA